MNFVFENYIPESSPVNLLDLSEIIDNAMMEKPISFEHFKIALKELIPEYTFSLDQSCMSMHNDIKNLQALCRNCHGKKTMEDNIKRRYPDGKL